VNNRAIASLLAQFGYLEAEELLSTPTITSAAYLEPLPIQLFWGCCWCSAKSNLARTPPHSQCPHDHLRFVPGICTFRSAGGTPTSGGKRCAYFCGGAETGDRLLRSALDQVGNSKAGLFCCSSSRRL